MLKVNGVTKNVPVFLNGSDVSVYASGSFTYISANFGLIVKYDGLYELTISVPSSYRYLPCLNALVNILNYLYYHILDIFSFNQSTCF